MTTEDTGTGKDAEVEAGGAGPTKRPADHDVKRAWDRIDELSAEAEQRQAELTEQIQLVVQAALHDADRATDGGDRPGAAALIATDRAAATPAPTGAEGIGFPFRDSTLFDAGNLAMEQLLAALQGTSVAAGYQVLLAPADGDVQLVVEAGTRKTVSYTGFQVVSLSPPALGRVRRMKFVLIGAPGPGEKPEFTVDFNPLATPPFEVLTGSNFVWGLNARSYRVEVTTEFGEEPILAKTPVTLTLKFK